MNIKQDEYLTLNLTETECKDIFLPYDDNYLIDYLMNCIDVSQRNDLLAECKNEALSYFSYSYNSTLDNYVDENGYYDINEFHVDFIKGYKFYEFIYEDEKIEDEYIEQKFSYEQADVLEDLVKIFIIKKLIEISIEQKDLLTVIGLNHRLIHHIGLMWAVHQAEKISRELPTIRNTELANKRWNEHNQTRPKKKMKYLQIMRDKGFTTYAQTATYIKQEIEKGDKPSYDTICRWLSQAGKGDFT